VTTTTQDAVATTVHDTGERMRRLGDLGQSLWLDYLRRGIVHSGELAALIDRGLRGVTSNPTIFEHAIGGSTDYDETIATIAGSVRTDPDLFERLAIDDVQAACDLFRPVYDRSGGAHGFVSLEVAPRLARDTDGTIAEVRRLWSAVARPNVMIKIPGTAEGLPAIEQSLAEGINVNVTLLFSVDRYREVAEAHMRALERRVKTGAALDRIASVASFFVSRVDSEVEKRLKDDPAALVALGGEVGIANARIAYAAFREITAGARWRALAAKGAQVQRPLWASTSTKNPAYPDVLYVNALIGPDTVNTVPPATLGAFEDHGDVAPTLAGREDEARAVLRRLADAGVDFADVTRVLEDEGIEKFAKSYDTLLGVIAEKRKAVTERSGGKRGPGRPGADAALGPLAKPVRERLETLARDQAVRRLWAHDPTLWSDDPQTPEIRNRLGWLTVGKPMARQAAALAAFANEVRGEFDRVVLCGMGGSSLAPEVLWRTFGKRNGYPSLVVLDTTDPRAIARIEGEGDLRRTLFLVSSKSGTTQETLSYFRYFWERTRGRGAQFVAITDPGTPLERLAKEQGFRRVFGNPADIGGRYSALSYFGLVPAALIGVDVAALLHRAHRMAEACASCVPAVENPGAWLGAVLGEAVRAGRDKVTFVLSPGVASYGLWAEQLLAESTGKQGTGVVPVADEPLGDVAVYGADRVFVSIALRGEPAEDTERRLAALAEAGHPVVRFTLEDRDDLGAEFFRWEFATAVAGAILKINAFDQPNVAESKANTKNVLAGEAKVTAKAADRAALDAFLSGIPAGHYLALMAYLPPNGENDRRLAAIRLALRDRLTVATTLGYGPRFLHSTGQLHKGGPATGHFLQITDPPAQDLAIPGESFTFGRLEAAQADGDYQALAGRGRAVLRVEGLGLLER
jgi:transaldolase/glucose-6-phosphate isomerase